MTNKKDSLIYENIIKMFDYGDSLVPEKKINQMQNLLLSVKNLTGEIAEIGVFKGGTALKIASLETETKIHLFDTFDGMPYYSENHDKTWKKGSFKGTNFEIIKNLFSKFKNVTVYKGVFPKETSKFIKDKKFKFIHLDVDNYQSYKECLTFLYPRLVKDGIIIFDDYEEECCPGAKKAVDEFFKNKEKIIFNETYFIKKSK